MSNLSSETIVMLLALVGAVCGIAGYVIARLGQRRAGGGKTAAELKTELSDYKENVAEHFQTTASLLHDMTEQYRSVYEHMASGAQTLCDPERATSQIESLRAGLLPASVSPVGDGEGGSIGSESKPSATTESETLDIDLGNSTAVDQAIEEEVQVEESASASEDSATESDEAPKARKMHTGAGDSSTWSAAAATSRHTCLACSISALKSISALLAARKPKNVAAAAPTPTRARRRILDCFAES